MIRIGSLARAAAATVFALCACVASAADPMISASPGHALALNTNGTVSSWGGDSFGQLGLGRTIFETRPIQVPGIAQARSVSGGFDHVLVADTAGRVWSWGSNSASQLGVRERIEDTIPSRIKGLTGIVQVVAGVDASAALRRDGRVYTWGNNFYVCGQQSAVPELLEGVSGVKQIALTETSIILLTVSGEVYSLGEGRYNNQGRCVFEQDDFTQLEGLPGIQSISANGDVITALAQDGTAYIFIAPYETSPRRVSTGGSVRQVYTSYAATTFLLTDGSKRVVRHETITASDTVIQTVPVNGLASLANVSYLAVNAAGNNSFFALRNDGALFAVGVNSDGQLGQGTTTDVSNAIRVSADATYSQVSTGAASVYGLRPDGSVWMWGLSLGGETGRGDVVSQPVARSIAGLTNIAQVAAGLRHSAARTADGRVYTWGNNKTGQLGFGDFVRRSRPALTNITNVVSVGAGDDFVVYAKSDGTVWLSGSLGSTTAATTPIQIGGLFGIQRVFAGYGSAFAIASNGSIYSWGANEGGQLGVGDKIARDTPTLIPGTTGSVVRSLSVGRYHALAATSDGRAFAWGANVDGQTGTGFGNTSLVPVQVGSDVVQVAAGSFYSLFALSDGSVWVTGSNSGGELGDESFESRYVPVKLNTNIVDRAVGVAAGYEASFTIRSDGSVLAWGNAARSGFKETLGVGTYDLVDRPLVVLQVDGGGNLDRNDWFLDLNPSVGGSFTADTARRRLLSLSQFYGGSSSASLTTQFNYRANDYGKNVKNYVVGLVPRGFVEQTELASSPDPVALMEKRALSAKAAGVSHKDWIKQRSRKIRSKADSDLVLVQLTPTGWQVVTSQLLALTTGVISGNGSAATILNNINLNQLPGAQFCIGYGSDANAMIREQTLTQVLAVPGAATKSGGVPCIKSGVYLFAPPKSTVGSEVSFEASVIGLAPSGNVSLRNNGTALAQQAINVVPNQAIQSVVFSFNNLSAGRYLLDASYSGDATNRAGVSTQSTHDRQFAPTVVLTGPNSVSVGSTVTFTARVNGGSSPSGEMEFLLNGFSAVRVAVSNGIATTTYTPSSGGSYSISAKYLGDSAHGEAESAPLIVTASAVNVDSTPDGFVFAPKSGVTPGSRVVSDPITVRGINAGSAISITGGEYSVSCLDDYVSTPSVVFEGQTVCVRHIAAGTAGASVSTQLTIGGISASFISTAANAPALDPNADEDSDGIPNGLEASYSTNPRAKDNDLFANTARGYDFFARQQYRDFLSREADNPGALFWAGEIAAGRQTRTSMIEAFTTSGEFESQTAPMARLYFATYLRTPDYGGLLFWTNEFRNGRRTLDQIGEAFATAPEFVNRYGQVSSRAFVDLVYVNILGRAPDQAGSNFWTAELDGGRLTRGQMLVRFSESAEYKARRAGEIFTTLMYAGMLKAAPDETSFALSVARINAGGSRRAEIDRLLESVTYRARFVQ